MVKAGRLVGLQLLCGNQTCPHRVQVYVMRDRRERPAFKQDRLVAPLKNMPPLSTEPVEPVRKRALQPAHPIHQIGAGRLHQKMVVVPHKTPSVQTPTLRLAGQFQALKETPARTRSLEDPLPVVPTVDHMVIRPLKFYPCLACHKLMDNKPTNQIRSISKIKKTWTDPVSPRKKTWTDPVSSPCIDIKAV